MMEKDQIKKWLAEGKITEAQAAMMIEESDMARKETSSNKFISTISIIGSVFLGIGVIWVVGANWDGMPDFLKIITLLGSTLGLLYAGYVIGFQKGTFPRTGHSLVLLAAILFGASIYLIAQIYNVEANASFLLFIWLIGIIPLIYVFQSSLITALSCIVFCFWFNSLLIEDIDDLSNAQIAFVLFFYQSFGIILFGLGSLHYFLKGFDKVSRTFRLLGIYLTIPVLFIFTFRYALMGIDEISKNEGGNAMISAAIYAVAGLMLLINFRYNPSRSAHNKLESATALVILTLLLVFNLTLNQGMTYYLFWVIFNVAFVGLLVILFRLGYSRMDMKLINIASFTSFFFLLFKFFDIFSSLLASGITWIGFGILLLAGSIWMEKKRRALRDKFNLALEAKQQPHD
ncbi:MAG: DUF2157 domain-containing protein [Saprospiraceae bacterium]|nr:DUF2157 domain-containing protein [Saprospiraceae bacterium]